MAKKANIKSKAPSQRATRDSSARREDLDALAHYLAEISKLKPLSRKEEENLSEKIKQGDAQAMNELVRRNLKYVVTVANKYKGCGLSLQDLIEEGNIGLIQAAKRFDGTRHIKFITYAVWWIRQAILHSLAEQARTVKIPIKQVGKLFKVEKRYKNMTDTLDREPTTREVAEDLGYKVEEIEMIQRAYRTHLSLDTPLKENEATEYLDLLETPHYIPYDDEMMRESLGKKIDDMLKHLSEREETIIRMRFGFGGEAKTLEEIGKEIGLSRERVRQIEKRAKERLRLRSAQESLQDHLD